MSTLTANLFLDNEEHFVYKNRLKSLFLKVKLVHPVYKLLLVIQKAVLFRDLSHLISYKKYFPFKISIIKKDLIFILLIRIPFY